MLSSLSIRSKLYLAFAAVLAILAVLVGATFHALGRLADANRWNVHTYEVIGEARATLAGLVDIETGTRGYALTGEQVSLEPYHAGKREFERHFAKVKELTADNAQQQERLARLARMQRDWMADANEPLIALRGRVAAGGESMDRVVALMREGRGKQGMDAMRVLFDEFTGAEAALLVVRSAEADALQRRTNAVLLGGGLLAIALGMAVATLLARAVVAPIRTAVRAAEAVAGGDLTQRIDAVGRDETAQLLQALSAMQAKLRDVVSRIQAASAEIGTASSQVATGNQDLSSRTEQQASNLQQTAASMEEVSSAVKQNSQSAAQAAQLAASALESASEGGRVVDSTIRNMDELNASSRKIREITSLIDGIAFQTNILALNAAVEAARAGESGRGFAVVANEVRTLASRSADAARQIATLIEESTDKVDAGADLARQAGAAMERIVESSRRVADIVGEISAASLEQTTGLEQVSGAVAQLDQVTQQNAALVEESAAAADSLKSQAAGLVATVGHFRT